MKKFFCKNLIAYFFKRLIYKCRKYTCTWRKNKREATLRWSFLPNKLPNYELGEKLNILKDIQTVTKKQKIIHSKEQREASNIRNNPKVIAKQMNFFF